MIVNRDHGAANGCFANPMPIDFMQLETHGLQIHASFEQLATRADGAANGYREYGLNPDFLIRREGNMQGHNPLSV
jgi:hypothetical protein